MKTTLKLQRDPKSENFLPILPGWNYLGRMYKPGLGDAGRKLEISQLPRPWSEVHLRG